jgi:tRNA(adenine34) deaminase
MMGPMSGLTHRLWMQHALEEARAAIEHEDVPVGAVVVCDGQQIARAHNRREADGDPTAHAEVLALRAAAAVQGSWRLDGCTLYTTLEPCAMCAGAMVLARLPGLVYAAAEPNAGAVGSVYDIARDGRQNHGVAVTTGVEADEAGKLLRQFFRSRRVAGTTPAEGM